VLGGRNGGCSHERPAEALSDAKTRSRRPEEPIGVVISMINDASGGVLPIVVKIASSASHAAFVFVRAVFLTVAR